MGRNFSNGLLAGVVAAVIWMAIGMWQGIETETLGMWALVFLVGTTVVATLVGAMVSGGRNVEGRRR